MRTKLSTVYQPLLIAVSIVMLVANPAPGLTKTTTRARVCRKEPCHVETFSGGYFIKGSTRPSRQGQIVRFFYRRVGRQRWHRFGHPGSTTKVFISMDDTASDRINSRHRWREHFDINGFVGFPHERWVLRARFIRQDGFAASGSKVRVRAAYGD